MIESRVRIKMCGLTRAEDLLFAGTLGIDAIGVNFAEQSPRYVSVQQAQNLLIKVPLFVDIVAVLVNPTRSFVSEVLQKLPIDYLQFHGEETPDFCEQFDRPYIKAIPAYSTEAIHQACEQYNNASAILLDTPSTRRGGTGERFDWTLIPMQLKKPFILAGGLDAMNVNAAVKHSSACAVDVSSGIESAPGIKDHEKMKQFVQALWGKV